MRVFYDKEVDAAYLRLSNERPTGVIEVAEGINVDVTESGGIAGIEILDVKRKFPLQSLFVYEYGSDLVTEEAGG